MKKNENSYELQHSKANVIYYSSNEETKEITPSYFHHTNELIYVTNGSIECSFDHERYVAEKDDILFVPQYRPHVYKMSDDYSDLVIVAGEKYWEDFKDIFKNNTFNPVLCDKEFNKKIQCFFYQLADKEINNTEFSKKGFINVIVGSILGHYPRIPDSSINQPSLFIKIVNYIDDHYKDDISLESLSKEFGYNKYYFSRFFNTYVGENLNSYINRIRIRAILNDLKKDNPPSLNTLIYSNGFNSIATFYRVFRTFYDCSPKELMRKNLNK